ncbi:MAG TPA: hypothetical protein VD926_07585, partial [Acidimicrobiales bacterium]|nr:hypothetical protein [Acidimicrobiales bacterium]
TVPTTIGVGATVTVECTTPTTGLLSPFDRRAVVSNQATFTTNETDPESSPEVEVDVVPPATGWTDVAEWYRAAADWMDHWDLADGFANGTQFRGTRPTSRGQFVRMVYRLAGEPEPPSPPTHSFTDVPQEFADAVAWAVENPDGPDVPLIAGLTRTRFGTGSAITRGQAVRALFRWANRFGPQTVPNPPTHSFTDVPQSLRAAVAWAANDPDGAGPQLRLVSGLSTTRFGPNANLSRGQTASVLHRLADRLDL